MRCLAGDRQGSMFKQKAAKDSVRCGRNRSSSLFWSPLYCTWHWAWSGLDLIQAFHRWMNSSSMSSTRTHVCVKRRCLICVTIILRSTVWTMICRSGIISLCNPGRQAADGGGVYHCIEVFEGMESICDGYDNERIRPGFRTFLEFSYRVVVRFD